MHTAVLTNRSTGISPGLQARIGGGLYLINIVTGVFAILFVRAALFVPGDVAATAANILAHQTKFRLGFVAEIVTCLTNIPMAVIFYNLFKVVNRDVARADVFFNLVGTAIEAVVLLNHFAPSVILQGSSGGFTSQQLQAQAYVSLQLQDVGLAIALVFFGVDILITGYLTFQSTFLPRIIGVLLAIEGVGYLFNSFAAFLAPALQARVFPYFMLTAIGEISLTLWLLVMGVNVSRWHERARETQQLR
jgi:hypothetical protein